MLTGILIGALKRAESPKSVGLIVRALERVTGVKNQDLFTFDVSNYPTNGFPLLSQGYRNFAGKTLNTNTALESSAFFSCIKNLSEDLGALPLHLYQRAVDRLSNKKAYDHPLYELLHDLPNPDMNAQAFVETVTARAYMTGTGYARIDRGTDGRILFLWPLLGEVTRDKNRFGRPVFIHKESGVSEKTFEAAQIFDLPGFSLTGMGGEDLILRLKQVLGLTLATQEYPARFFANDASPGIILTRPAGTGQPWDDPTVAEIKEKWSKWHRGINRAHEPAILQDGVTANRLDPDHGKLQLIEQRKFQVTELSRPYRMPAHKLGDLEHATFSNIEEQDISYTQDVLSPGSVRWRQSIYRCLLSVEERRAGYFAEHDLAAYQKGRYLDQASAWARLLEKGVFSINEVRRLQNYPPVDGGDEHNIQLNMAPIDSAPATQPSKIVPINNRKG